jgi:hypothetical protein
VELGHPTHCRSRTKRTACVIAVMVIVAGCSSTRHLSTPRTTTTFASTVNKAHDAPKPAHQASTPSAQPPVGLSLVNQTIWLPLRQTVTMKLHIDEPALAAMPGAAISIRIHQSAASRTGFDEMIAKRNLGIIIYEPNPIRVASLRADRQNNVSIEFGVDGSEKGPIVINHPGIYPVEVQLVNIGTPSTAFVTSLVSA